MSKEHPHKKFILAEAHKCVKSLRSTRAKLENAIKQANDAAQEIAHMDTAKTNKILDKACDIITDSSIKIAQIEISLKRALKLIEELESEDDG